MFLSHFSFKKGGSGELETLFFDPEKLKRDSLCVAQPKHGGTRVNSIRVGVTLKAIALSVGRKQPRLRSIRINRARVIGASNANTCSFVIIAGE